MPRGTLGLQRMYTAVRPLLNAMYGVEKDLEVGGAMARALAVGSLLRSGKGDGGGDVHVGGADGWEKRAAVVKGLLWERMGF
jgi:hypothetical protein